MKFLILAVLVLVTGCTSHRATNATSVVDTTIAATADPHRGRQLFANKCAACHGGSGQGASIGPALRNERARKNLVQTAAWIKDPDPPMPKLYPAELTAKDVADVAAFVQSL